MAGRKRERSPDLEEFRDVTAVMHASPDAKVHGIVTRLSPMKKRKKSEYFNGELSNEKTKMRLFGFEATVHEQGAAVSLERCAVKLARDGKKIRADGQEPDRSRTIRHSICSESYSGSGGKVMTCDQIEGLEDYDRVTVVEKVACG